MKQKEFLNYIKERVIKYMFKYVVCSRKLLCILVCLVTLAGCGNKEKPKQYVAELSNPYLSTLPSSFNKRLDVSYQFQNTLSKEGDFSTIDFLHLEVYKDDTIIGYKIVTAKNANDYLKDGEYDMILGRTDVHLDVEVKRGDKLRIVGEVHVHYVDDDSKDTTLTDEIEYKVK